MQGNPMFVLRSLCWLSTVLFLLPPSGNGQPAPRVNLLHAAYSARILAQDLTGVCGREPEACRASRAALQLLTRKMATGAEILSSGLSSGLTASAAGAGDADHGTLRPEDLQPAWSAAAAVARGRS